jgi:serine/threonine protein kinase
MLPAASCSSASFCETTTPRRQPAHAFATSAGRCSTVTRKTSYIGELEFLKFDLSFTLYLSDIKPENILLMNDLDDSDIRIADFGLAVRVSGDTPSLTHVCGTVGYAAPEIFNGEPYGKAVDMYALGAVAYGLIGGYPPFDADTDEEILAMSREGHLVFHSPYWDEVSPEAKDFIGRLLSVDPSCRLTAQQALEHEWVSQSVNWPLYTQYWSWRF